MPFDQEGNWMPNQKQAQFLAVPDSISEAAYLGGAGSGKSELLLMFAIVRKWHEVSGFKQLFTRRTYPELKREIVPRSFEIYPKFGGKFNKNDMCWEFMRPDQFGSDAAYAGGGRVFFGHCENESDVHLYDSMEINLFTPDEVTSYSEFIYMYIGFTRVRTSNPILPAIIRPAGMPGGVGHNWVKRRFVDPFPKGGKLIVGKGGNKRIFIFATLEDNKDHIDPNYAQKLDALPEAERQAKKFGSFDAYSGQVFSELRDKKYDDEPENALHVIDYFEPPAWWPRIVAIDWGFNAMTSVGWAAVSPDRRVYFYRHQVFNGVKISIWAPEVRYFVDKEKPKIIKICHSAAQQRGEDHNIHEQVQEALGESIELGERDRVGGKSLIHEYLRWTPRPTAPLMNEPFDEKVAQWIYRNKGLIEYNQYLAMYQPQEPEKNLPKLQILKCENYQVLIDSLKACVYEKEDNSGKKKEDVAEFQGDDPYDMLRMLLRSVDTYFGESSDTQQKIEQMQSIIDSYKTTGDNTAYYRNMRRLEAGERMIGVKRFHSRRNRLHARH